MRNEETTSIPVFCTAEEVKEWSGLDLNIRTVTARQLLQSIPAEWWITFRPGSDTGKEFSPWEITELAQGPEGIEAVLDEIFASTEIEPLQYQESEEEEYVELKNALMQYAKKTTDIASLTLLKHEESSLLQLGVGITHTTKKAQVREELSSMCQRALVGDRSWRVFLFDQKEPGAVGLLFQKAKPFYSKSKETLSARILKVLGFYIPRQ